MNYLMLLANLALYSAIFLWVVFILCLVQQLRSKKGLSSSPMPSVCVESDSA